MSHTSQDALYAARMAHVEGLAPYTYENAKTNAAVYLHNYRTTRRHQYLLMAVYMTQVALYIARLSKFN